MKSMQDVGQEMAKKQAKTDRQTSNTMGQSFYLLLIINKRQQQQQQIEIIYKL